MPNNAMCSSLYPFLRHVVLGFSLCVLPGAYAEPVTLNLKDADINALITTVSQITGKNFIVDPRVRGTVSIISAKPMEEEEIYQVFLSILAVHGFAAIPGNNVTKIVPAQNAKQDAIPNQSGEHYNGSDQQVTRVIPVKNVAAAQIVPIIRPLVPPEGHLAAYTPTNVLIVSDLAANVDRLVEIIESIDKASDESIEKVALKHASAQHLAKVLAGLSQGAGGAGAAQSVNLLQAQSDARVVADERSNTLLVAGSPAARARMKKLIIDLDTPLANSNTQVIYLRYAKASNILPILQGLTQPNTQGAAALSTTTNATDSTSSNGVASYIQADETTNAIIISAESTQLNNLKEIIAKLDVRRAQVLVEAVIAEVSYAKASQLGVQWVLGGDSAYGLLNFTNGGASVADIAAVASSKTPIQTAASLGLGKTPLGGIVLGDNSGSVPFGALVQAIGRDGDSNVLSTPSLVTLDNEEAEIIVGQNVPFVTGTYTTNTTGNSNSNIGNPFQTIERQDVGISLKIKPQINEGNAVKLEIAQEVSNIDSASSASVNGPTTNKRALKTNVIVEDGQVLVLGGLMDDQVRETLQKVPGLGDLPLIGNLFRSRESNKEKRNLMIFLRPVILRDQHKANASTANKYEFIQEAQLKAQQRDDSLIKDELKPRLPNLDQVQTQGSFIPATPPAPVATTPADKPPVTAPLRPKTGIDSFDNPYGRK